MKKEEFNWLIERLKTEVVVTEASVVCTIGNTLTYTK